MSFWGHAIPDQPDSHKNSIFSQNYKVIIYLAEKCARLACIPTSKQKGR